MRRAWAKRSGLIVAAAMLLGAASVPVRAAQPPAIVHGATPACSNTIDDDLDDLVDFPADPGCASPDATSEAPEPDCGDAADNDADSAIDYPDDRDCYAATDPSELPACSDGLDNDADGLSDLADPDCLDADDRTEAALPACADLEDDDGDGLVDYPLDPGCASAVDTDETDAPVQAAPGRPRVLIAVGSAGTLNDDACEVAFTGGDGSLECPGADVACAVCDAVTCGNGLADDSKLAQLRTGLRAALSRVGAVEVGLLRARQRAGEFTCPTGGLLSPSGGWQGGGADCAGGFDAGEVLVAVGDDTWPAFDRLLDFEGGSAAGAPGADFELRGSGHRPLGAMLAASADHLQDVRAGDPAGECRAYHVVLIADGSEQCGTGAAAQAGLLLQAGMPVHVLGLGDSAPALNAIASAGGTGSAIAVSGSAEIAAVLDQLFGELQPRELCNGADDDCDGQADEDFPQLGLACDNGQLGACHREGSWICGGDGGRAVCSATAIAPGMETCNGVDDDCDGAIDEDGVCATQELCNGLDDDLDGQTDEDFAIGAACTSGLGACAVPGTLACSADQLGTDCRPNAPPPLPARHDLMCDGIDEDCDGLLDEEAFGAMAQVSSGSPTFFIDRYEASRPGSTAAAEGLAGHRACAEPAVLPWRNPTHAEAAAACAAAGKRLCTQAELVDACAGGAGLTYPYGNVFQPNACNGEDHDPDCALPDDDRVLPTAGTLGCPAGPASTCQGGSGIHDLSGNLREWTATPPAPTFWTAHGGGYLDQPPALACGATVALEATTRRADLGFRCCADTLPELPPVLEVSVGGAGTGTVSSTPGGIHCPSDCQQDYPAGTVVELVAVAFADARFTGWSGACTGEDPCVIELAADVAVSAQFEPRPTGEAVFADGFEGAAD